MNKFLACLVAVAAISLTAQESQAQFYRGGSGISIGIGGVGGGFGYNSFRAPYGRVGGVSIRVGNGFGPVGGFYGGGFAPRGFYGAPVIARPIVVPAYRPVYRPVYVGGFYRGYGGGYRSCGGW